MDYYPAQAHARIGTIMSANGRGKPSYQRNRDKRFLRTAAARIQSAEVAGQSIQAEAIRQKLARLVSQRLAGENGVLKLTPGIVPIVRETQLCLFDDPRTLECPF